MPFNCETYFPEKIQKTVFFNQFYEALTFFDSFLCPDKKVGIYWRLGHIMAEVTYFVKQNFLLLIGAV